MTTRRLIVPVSAALVLALAGCTAGSPTAADPTTTPATTATATATPEPVRPDLDDLLVSPDGVGPLLIGQPVVVETAETAIVAWNPTGCVEAALPDLAEGDPYAGYWDTTYSDDPSTKDLVIVTDDGTEGGPIGSLLVRSDAPTTAEGIHVGSTREELLRAYPDLVPEGDQNLTELYTIAGDSGVLEFEVAIETPELPGYWTPEEIGTVLWMRIVDGPDDVGSIAGSDAGGACPV
jgi:hypothetical protein